MTESEPEQQNGLVTCRAGLERVIADELKELAIEVTRIGTRAVFFRTDRAGVYRANMGLRSALSVLLPIRRFNARNYDMLYFQSRKTFWHKMFSVDRTVRIDVNGGSSQLRNTQYVVHRVKDGIVDTFRKLCEGKRPSIDKRDPDVHVVVHLDGPRVTLCLDTSGVPLFKRGYRVEHGEAPLKEDLAAGILALSGWDGRMPLCDPMCGAGTFLFEGWMRATRRAPNLERRFAFESLFSYDPATHAAEQEALRSGIIDPPTGFELFGCERAPAAVRVMERIHREHFPEAPLRVEEMDFRALQTPPVGCFAVTNPPYGRRLGGGRSPDGDADSRGDLNRLYRDLGCHLRRIRQDGGSAAVLSAWEDAARTIGLEPTRRFTLYNGAIRCDLLCFS